MKELERTFEEQKESNEKQLSKKSAEIEVLKEELTKAREIEPPNKRQKLDSDDEHQNKFQEYAILNFELQRKLRAVESENEKLKQQIKEKFNQQEVEQKEAEEKEEFQKQFQEIAMSNFELQRKLRVEESETNRLKQKNEELEHRINMLHNADNISEFVQDNDRNTAIKQEFVEKEIKQETE